MLSCLYKGCNRPHEAKGFCTMHYSRLRKHNNIEHTYKKKGKCSICNNIHYAKKFCKMHYERFKKYGDPNFKKMNDFGNGWIYDGYRHYEINGIKYREHRSIIEAKIGRNLTYNEVVHHINGIKDDNRPENLMIMDRSKHSSMHMIEYHKLKKINKY